MPNSLAILPLEETSLLKWKLFCFNLIVISIIIHIIIIDYIMILRIRNKIKGIKC